MHLLRTYRQAGEFQPDLSIAQACHGALAASELVGPCAISAAGFSYVDGLSGWNNPSFHVLSEAQHIWPDLGRRDVCLVSLGLGVPARATVKSLPKPVARSIMEWATEAEVTSQRLERERRDLVDSGHHTRLSVGRELEGVGLDERSGTSLADATEAYLRVGSTVETIHRCAARLRSSHNSPTREPLPKHEPDAGPADASSRSNSIEVKSPPYEEKEEELVPYSELMGEKPVKKRTTWPFTCPSRQLCANISPSR